MTALLMGLHTFKYCALIYVNRGILASFSSIILGRFFREENMMGVWRNFIWDSRSCLGVGYIGVGGVTLYFKNLLWFLIGYRVKFRLVNIEKGAS